MADNLTGRETHIYDQNVAQFAQNLDAMITDWSQMKASACCEEHATIDFCDHLVLSVEHMGSYGAAGMLLAAAKRLTP